MNLEIKKIPQDLIIAQKDIYLPNNFIIKSFKNDPYSKEYCACTFELNNKIIKFRVAKITPKKVGQFVTLWKRADIKSPITPFDMTDSVDLFIISVKKNENLLGQFIFPKDVLCQKGYVSKENKGGKLAMRVYAPWDEVTSTQAAKTQQWQLNYFVEIQPQNDTVKLINLLS